MSYNISKLKADLQTAGEWLSKEYSQIHSGRATPLVLDSVFVESYGAKMPVKNVASITIEDPKTLRVAPWDKSQVKDIERAISNADIGLSVNVDADGLRIIFPMLTTERRAQFVKILKGQLEDARITVRKIREASLSELKTDALPEDSDKRAKDEIQKAVDEANKNLESLFAKKEAEIMS